MTSSERLRHACHRPLRLVALMLHRSYRRALRHPKTVLGVTALLAIVLNILISRMPTYFTMEETLDPRLPSVAATRTLNQAFKAGVSLHLVFRPADGQPFTAAELCRLKTWLRTDLYNLSVEPRWPIIAVNSAFDLAQAASEDGRVWLPPLVKPPCDTLEPLPLYGPATDGAQLATLLRPTPWHDHLARDTAASDLLVEVVFQDEEELAALGRRFPPTLAFALDESLKAAFAGQPHVTWQLSGPAAFRAYSKAASDFDMTVNLLIPVILTVLFRWLYGSWIGGALITLAIVLMRTGIFGTMAACGYPIDPLSGSLVLLVSLSAIEDFLFVTRHRLRTQAPWRTCYQRFLIPSLLTSLTTFVGFASLMLSDISTVHDIGMWAAFGTLLQWAIVYFVLPCLHVVWPRTRTWARSERARLALVSERLAGLSLPRVGRRLVLPLLAAALAVVPLLSFEDALTNFFPPQHPFNQAMDYLRASRGWDGALSVTLARGVDPGTQRTLLETLRADPRVKRVETGQELVAFVEAPLSGLARSMVRRLVSVGDAYQSFFNEDLGQRWVVYLTGSDLRTIKGVMAVVGQTCPPPACQAAGALAVFVDFAQEVAESLFVSFGSSLAIVAGFLMIYAWLCRQPYYLAILASALWGPIVMLAAMVVLRIPVNFVSCFFAAILVGLAGDNAIQYLHAARRGSLLEGIDARGAGSVEITLCMVLVALLLLCSAFAPPKTLGVILAVGLVVNLAGDLWILKLLLPSAAPAPAPLASPVLPRQEAS